MGQGVRCARPLDLIIELITSPLVNERGEEWRGPLCLLAKIRGKHSRRLFLLTLTGSSGRSKRMCSRDH